MLIFAFRCEGGQGWGQLHISVISHTQTQSFRIIVYILLSLTQATPQIYTEWHPPYAGSQQAHQGTARAVSELQGPV